MEKENLTTMEDEQVLPPCDESVEDTVDADDEPCDNNEKKFADRKIVREATVNKWLEKAQNDEDISSAPEWVQKEIGTILKVEDQKSEQKSENFNYQSALQVAREKSGLSETEFEARYGEKFSQELATLIDYGVPFETALAKSIAILGIRNEADKKREELRSVATMPPRSNVNTADEFYLVNTDDFDVLTDYQRKKYISECENRFGEVRFA